MKIGFFDSGVGGLSVLHTARQILPPQQYIYFADSKNAPYGTKSKKEVKKLTINAVDFLHKKEIDALVIACNTATSVAIEKLRKEFDFPIIGMEPAIKPAIEKSKTKKVLLVATALTLKEKKLHQLLDQLNATQKVDGIALPDLILFAEKMEWKSPKVFNYLEKRLKNISWKNYSSIVLGCTHFLFFRTHFRKIIPPHIEIIDGNLGTILHLKNQIHLTSNLQKNSVKFFISEKKVASRMFQPHLNWLKKQSS